MPSSICCIKGCELPVTAMGLCINHWRNNKKHGSPVSELPLCAENVGLSAEERFFKSIKKIEGGCWLWTAGVDKDGYGRFKAAVNGVSVARAHRFSLMYHTGEVLDRHQLAMHSCDNPPCCNPDHLSAGSASENARDMVAKGRHIAGKRAQSAKVSKLSEDQVIKILMDRRKYEDIAADYGIHKQHVLLIKTRKTRTFVEIDPSLIVRNQRGSKGEDRSRTLTEQDVRDIRASTERGCDLAERYRVTRASICDIQKRRSWKHLE